MYQLVSSYYVAIETAASSELLAVIQIVVPFYLIALRNLLLRSISRYENIFHCISSNVQ
jgi:hypothetical protein